MSEQFAASSAAAPNGASRKAPLQQQEIRQAQIKHVMRQLPLVLMADIIAGSFLFIIMANLAPRLVTFAWCGVLLVSSVVRLLMTDHFRKHLEAPDYARQWQFLLVGVGFSGLIWGSAWLMIQPDASLLEKGLVILWLGGMLAGAASTLSVIYPLFCTFVIPAALLTLGYLLIQGGEDGYALAGGLTMFLGFMFPIALRISNDLNYSIRLKLSNLDLQAQLKLDAERLTNKESELLKQVLLAQSLKTEKAQAQEKLKEADDNYLMLLNAMDEGIFGLDTDGRISFINRSALDLLKFEHDTVVGAEALGLINKRTRDAEPRTDVEVAIRGCLHQGNACHHLVSTFSQGNNQTLPVRFSCRPVLRGDDIAGAVINFSDITHQREMEAALLKAHKMEAIGRITGGVAHDFNNLLTVIIGNLQFLRKRLTNDEKIRSSNLLNKITNAAKSGAELNNRLLSFTREQTLLLEPQDINAVLVEISEFIRRIMGEQITIELRLSEESCVALTDRGQFENAIVNLCVNAKDAMPLGGTLTISTQKLGTNLPCERDNKPSRLRHFIIVHVADTGTGMPQSVREQVFEPFFTTKKKHHGTGLGLSTVYGFLRQSGGDITADSKEGEGSVFKMYLPVSELPVELEDNDIGQQITDSKSHSGTVLVVEDDIGVRDVASQMLMESGFKVIAVGNARDALEYLKRTSSIDLVFSDIVMPGEMDGIELAAELVKLKPDLPVVLATGYTDRLHRDNIPRVKNIICVGKPYDTNKLPVLINSLITGQGNTTTTSN